MEYKKTPTTPEVWAVIKARHHKDLMVFSSYSAPDGDRFGDPDQGRMMTEYGLVNAGCPLMGADTRWDIDREKLHKRINERHEYWLCVPVDSDS